MKHYKWLGGFLLLSSLFGCGGGDGVLGSTGANRQAPQMVSGAFVDSPVEGLAYTCGSQKGVTDSKGRFTCEMGQTITFHVGGIVLPAIPVGDLVTPLSVFGVTSYDDPRAVNLARLLQSLDSDSNPANGISIPASVLATAQGMQLTDFSSADFDQQVQPLINSVGRSELISAADAVGHMKTQSVKWYMTKMEAALETAEPDTKASFQTVMAEYLKSTDVETARNETKVALDKMMAGAPDLPLAESNSSSEASNPNSNKQSIQAAVYCYKLDWGWYWWRTYAYELVGVWKWNYYTNKYEYVYEWQYVYAWRYIYGLRYVWGPYC